MGIHFKPFSESQQNKKKEKKDKFVFD